MKIYLKDSNVKPTRTSTARAVPKRFEAPAKKAVQDLIKKGVIIRVTTPTEWCSPAFFVPKADGKNVRMVTDFTRLNFHVERPVHPFPSVDDIVKAIPPTAKFFAKMDAVHGYFPRRRQLLLHHLPTTVRQIPLPQGTLSLIHI